MASFEASYCGPRSDSGLSSCSNETLLSKDFRISLPVLPVDLFAREEIMRVEHIANSIRRNKEEFLTKYLDMNKKIENMMEQTYWLANARRQELKAQLQEIENTEIASWNRQLKICEEAEDWLKNIKTDLVPLDETLQRTCNKYARSIGFISSLEIKFDKTSVQNDYGEKIQPKFFIGRKGLNPGEFNQPWGICTDAAGRILVADRGNNRVQIFNEHGRFLLQFGKLGTDAGSFKKPVGITVDKKSRIIVTDKNNHRVQVFTSTGGFIFMFGRRGSKPGQFQYPWDVDTNSEGDVAVSDTNNHRVQLFTQNGVFVAEFSLGRYTEGLIRSSSPCGVAFKPDDTLLVTDTRKHIIFKIDEKFMTATKIESCLNFLSPQGIASNSQGYFVVADGKNDRIQVFDDQEKLDRMFGVHGSRLGEFDYPQGICFHPNGSIIVNDFGNNRIQVF